MGRDTMSERDAVINEFVYGVTVCKGEDGHVGCMIINPHLYAKVLDLLKERETADTRKCRVFNCSRCGYGIDDIFINDEGKYPILPNYCPNCGRTVKWD